MPHTPRVKKAESNCSNFFIEYTLDRNISAISGVSIDNPISNDATPDVTVTGMDSGDLVHLFTDQNCLLVKLDSESLMTVLFQ